MTTLNLNGNLLSDVAFLQGFVRLTKLDLSSNRICDLDQLCLKRLKFLTEVRLHGNPLDYSKLRETIVMDWHFQKLAFLSLLSENDERTDLFSVDKSVLRQYLVKYFPQLFKSGNYYR